MRYGFARMSGMRMAIIIMMMGCGQAYAFEKIQEVTSSTGVKAWLMEDHSLPLVAIKGAVRHAGSAYSGEGNDEIGRAHV